MQMGTRAHTAVWTGLAAAVLCTQHTLACLLPSCCPGNLVTGSVPLSWLTSGESLPKQRPETFAPWRSLWGLA